MINFERWISRVKASLLASRGALFPRRGRVMLHIGRNKAGSTTIQDLCLRGHARLLSEGISYAMFGHLSQSQPALPGFATFEALAAYACGHPLERHLVSNEFMFGWPQEYTEAAVGALSSCDVRILAYIRTYDIWVVSAYAEETRRGMNQRSIDDYVDWLWPRISAWTYLEVWGECFDWNNIHLRDTDPASLDGGDLCSDFLRAIGARSWSGDLRSSNVSPHWIELELARSLTERNGDVEWIGLSHGELEPLLGLLKPLIEGEPSVPYLSLARRRELVELYNSDLVRIEAAGGPKLPLKPAPTDGERAFIPAFSRVRPSILQAFFDRAASAEFALAFPASAARAARLGREMGYAGGGGDG